MKWHYITENSKYDMGLTRDVYPGSADEQDYLQEVQEDGWELMGPPVNPNTSTTVDPEWVYYWKRQVEQ